MPAVKRRYSYQGGVRRYNQIIASDFTAQTMAVSEKQAVNNILHQYKTEHGYLPGASAFSLTGSVERCEEPIIWAGIRRHEYPEK